MNQLLQLAFSKRGVLARHLAMLLTGALVARLHFTGDTSSIESLAEQLIGDALAAAFLGFQMWLNAAHSERIKTVQALLNLSSPAVFVDQSGVVCDATLDAATEIGIPAVRAAIRKSQAGFVTWPMLASLMLAVIFFGLVCWAMMCLGGVPR